jgi:hypothetical protein
MVVLGQWGQKMHTSPTPATGAHVQDHGLKASHWNSLPRESGLHSSVDPGKRIRLHTSIS